MTGWHCRVLLLLCPQSPDLLDRLVYHGLCHDFCPVVRGLRLPGFIGQVGLTAPGADTSSGLRTPPEGVSTRVGRTRVPLHEDTDPSLDPGRRSRRRRAKVCLGDPSPGKGTGMGTPWVK